MKITKKLKQTAVYWEFIKLDGYGHGTYQTEVELTVRWEDTQEVFVDDTGREVLSQAVIVSSVPLVKQSMLFLGSIGDLDSGVTDPQQVDGAREVRKTDAVKNLRATQTLYTNYLV